MALSAGRELGVDSEVSPRPWGGRLHPWLHVDGTGVIVGRVTDAGAVQLLSSAREALDLEALRPWMTHAPRAHPGLAGRWGDEAAEAWLAGGPAPTFSEVLALLISELRAAVEFSRREDPALVAVWALGTYFARCFLAFPRLALTGERGSGKTKVLSLLHGVAFNASLCVNATPAVLFRLIEETRPTLLVDEAETLESDQRRELLGIINAGYKRGTTVPRVAGDRPRRVEFFDVFSPIALGGIRGLHATTEDRCIPLVMQRGTDSARVNAEVNPEAPALARIRDGCYRLLLTRSAELTAALAAVPLPAWLNARARELWRPLLALAHVADQEESALGIGSDLLCLAREHVEDREDSSPEAEAMLVLLAERLAAVPAVSVRPGDLAAPLRDRLGWRDTPTPEAMSRLLRRLGFRPGRRDRAGRRYDITIAQLQGVAARYTPDPTVTPSPSPPNHAECHAE